MERIEVAKKWGRVITAMVTPFDDSQEVNYRAARKLARHLLASGTDAVLLSGTTGESPTLSHPEKINLWREVVDELGADGAVIAGTGTNSTRDSVVLTEEAERIGVHGVMLVAPYYNKPSQEGLYAHFKEVASCTSLPVMVYNVPGRTGCNLLPSTLASIVRDVPNVVAVKEASGNLDQVSEVVRLTRAVNPGFLVYSGDDSLTLPILSVGGHGVVSVASHLAGSAISKMVEAYFAGDVAGARDIHLKLFPLFKAMFITSNPMPVKTALRMFGVKVGGFRLPMNEMPDDARASLRKALEAGVADGLIDEALVSNPNREV